MEMGCASDPLEVLSAAWFNLRLSVKCRSRVGTWDAILLTAASAEQAELYQWQLEKAKQRERIAEDTIVLAVPDPGGRRIGSGGATLAAIRQLAIHINTKTPESKISFRSIPQMESERPLGDTWHVTGMRVLLVHAGGDSKRLPWANPIGKAFLPLPFLAKEDPDAPVPLLFDHILAISSRAVQHFEDEGGLFIMTGDVLPCFDASKIMVPKDGACVVTVAAPLAVASNHGVIVSHFGATEDPPSCDSFSNQPQYGLVDDLLQKPSNETLFREGAVGPGSTALLDTGLFAIKGEAWKNLVSLSVANPNPVDELLALKTEVSLYEELAGAWVPAQHEKLKLRPLGTAFIASLGSQRLHYFSARDLRFFHFGTSAEVLDHLGKDHVGRVGRRHYSSIMGRAFDHLAPSAVVVSSFVHEEVTIGKGSFVFDCTLESGVKIGSECILMGISLKNFTLPDRHCVWEVPLKESEDRVVLCCGIDDNPKAHIEQGGTFCGNPWSYFISCHQINKQEIWLQTSSLVEDLWFAKLFPILPAGKGYDVAMWLMGVTSSIDESILKKWRQSEKISLADLHKSIDFGKLYHNVARHRARLAAGFAEDSLKTGSMDRNLARLCQEISHEALPEAQSLKSLVKKWSDYKVDVQSVPVSRVSQVYADLYQACGDQILAFANEQKAWQAVAAETAVAVGQQCPESEVKWFNFQSKSAAPFEIFSRSAVVQLPVRVDIVGGWSDTPPWSLEHIGCVLNMAILLEGSAPIGAEVHVTSMPGVSVSDDVGNSCFIDDSKELNGSFLAEDPFRLVKAALAVTGYILSDQSLWGLKIHTWANLPRGSGLGSSSILAAAVVKALLQVKGSDSSDSYIIRLVLVLEQIMGTGGGWQDQVGGVYSGIKCTTSYPGPPLTLHVQSVHIQSQLQKELEQRMLLVFTGQVRLARTVLQRVVQRYLQRDAVLIKTVRRLAELSNLCQEALMAGDVDYIGEVMLEAWHLHQELDPHCSNSFVDQLFKKISPYSSGFKLAGAGGGGFALILAKDAQNAATIIDVLKTFGQSIQVYTWSLCLSRAM